MLKFSLSRKTLDIEIDGKKYVMKELTGKQRDEHLNDTAKRMRFDSKGNVLGISNFDGMQAKLLCLCIVGPNGQPVTEKEVAEWPASLVEALHKEAQRLSGIGGKEGQAAAEDEAKND